MSNLAGVLREMGELAEARDLIRQVLTARRRILGDDHPDTLTTMGNLATVLHEMGELSEAQELWREALPLAEETWGPRTANTQHIRSMLD